MKYEILKDQKIADAWRVEAIDYDNEGAVYVTLFFEPKAEERARAYALLVSKQMELQAA